MSLLEKDDACDDRYDWHASSEGATDAGCSTLHFSASATFTQVGDADGTHIHEGGVALTNDAVYLLSGASGGKSILAREEGTSVIYLKQLQTAAGNPVLLESSEAAWLLNMHGAGAEFCDAFTEHLLPLEVEEHDGDEAEEVLQEYRVGTEARRVVAGSDTAGETEQEDPVARLERLRKERIAKEKEEAEAQDQARQAERNAVKEKMQAEKAEEERRQQQAAKRRAAVAVQSAAARHAESCGQDPPPEPLWWEGGGWAHPLDAMSLDADHLGRLEQRIEEHGSDTPHTAPAEEAPQQQEQEPADAGTAEGVLPPVPPADVAEQPAPGGSAVHSEGGPPTAAGPVEGVGAGASLDQTVPGLHEAAPFVAEAEEACPEVVVPEEEEEVEADAAPSVAGPAPAVDASGEPPVPCGAEAPGDPDVLSDGTGETPPPPPPDALSTPDTATHSPQQTQLQEPLPPAPVEGVGADAGASLDQTVPGLHEAEEACPDVPAPEEASVAEPAPATPSGEPPVPRGTQPAAGDPDVLSDGTGGTPPPPPPDALSTPDTEGLSGGVSPPTAQQPAAAAAAGAAGGTADAAAPLTPPEPEGLGLPAAEPAAEVVGCGAEAGTSERVASPAEETPAAAEPLPQHAAGSEGGQDDPQPPQPAPPAPQEDPQVQPQAAETDAACAEQHQQAEPQPQAAEDLPHCSPSAAESETRAEPRGVDSPPAAVPVPEAEVACAEQHQEAEPQPQPQAAEEADAMCAGQQAEPQPGAPQEGAVSTQRADVVAAQPPCVAPEASGGAEAEGGLAGQPQPELEGAGGACGAPGPEWQGQAGSPSSRRSASSEPVSPEMERRLLEEQRLVAVNAARDVERQKLLALPPSSPMTRRTLKVLAVVECDEVCRVPGIWATASCRWWLGLRWQQSGAVRSP